MRRAIRLAPGKWVDALSWATILAFMAAVALGLLVPVYVDEVATKLVQARFLAEGGQMLSLFPQCTSGFILDTPLTWYPAAVVFSLLYGHLQPVGLRIAGIAILLAWVAAVVGWVYLTIPDARGRLHSLAGMAGILSFGVLPLTMVLARAEQFLLLLLTCYLLLAAGAGRVDSRGGAWTAAVLFGLFVLLTSLLNYTHPKALFFLPFVIVAAFCILGTRRKWLPGLAVAFAIFCAYQTFGFARAVTRCEETPVLSGILGAQTTKLSLAFSDPIGFLAEVSGNLVAAPGKIAEHGVIQSTYQSAWLPPVPFATSGAIVKAVNLGATGTWYLACLLAALLPPLVFLRRPGQDGNGAGQFLIPALWIGLVGHLALYKEWNFYGGSLIVALTGLLLVHGLGRTRALQRLSVLANLALASVLLLSLTSTAVLGIQQGPRLLKAARSTDAVPANQAYSLNAYAYAGARDRIRNLAEACGLPGDGATRLVVDDLAYFAFTGLHQPMHLGFLWPGGWGADIAGKTRDLLTGMQSEGIIGRCSLIAPEFRHQTLRDGNLCCVDLKDRKYF